MRRERQRHGIGDFVLLDTLEILLQQTHRLLVFGMIIECDARGPAPMNHGPFPVELSVHVMVAHLQRRGLDLIRVLMVLPPFHVRDEYPERITRMTTPEVGKCSGLEVSGGPFIYPQRER